MQFDHQHNHQSRFAHQIGMAQECERQAIRFCKFADEYPENHPMHKKFINKAADAHIEGARWYRAAMVQSKVG